ncbi:MAG: hypothetical protein QGD92_03320 [Gammaproteobacteria bacterium]|nr:hypothetical protein [Gammaproteobacteria bacterium]
MYLKNCVVILSLLAAPLSSADIYRCQMGDGKWLFTDRQCTNGAGQKIKLSSPVTIRKLEPTGLSEAEHRALIDLDQRMAASRDFRIKQRKKISSQIRKNNKIKQQNCALAARQLAKIQDKKSHGYKLSEANELDQQVRKLEAEKRVNCR